MRYGKAELIYGIGVVEGTPIPSSPPTASSPSRPSEVGELVTMMDVVEFVNLKNPGLLQFLEFLLHRTYENTCRERGKQRN